MSLYLKNIQEPQQSLIAIGDYAVAGTDESCQIRVMDTESSDRHARFERQGDKLLVRDLKSGSGTYINEARIMEAWLQSGDLLKIGRTEFFVVGEPTSEFQCPLTSKNAPWSQQLAKLPSLAKSNHPVLVLGPSGTGKELVAKSIHALSSRRDGPFIGVNCSALTETLIESELFGHVRGSFTGAISDRKGAFEAARGGTLFLDEVGDLPYGLQAKLLRALENSEIRPVGSDKISKTDVRIVAATHHGLIDKVQEGQFRLDLFYRLNVLRVDLPALKERMEDFVDLFYTFAKEMRTRFSFLAIQELKNHDWPGNIRELRNVIARASAFFPGQLITETLVKELIDPKSANQVIQDHIAPSDKQQPVIKEIEKQMILRRMAVNQGNQRRTALDLKMPKSTLHDKLRAYKIDPETFKHL